MSYFDGLNTSVFNTSVILYNILFPPITFTLASRSECMSFLTPVSLCVSVRCNWCATQPPPEPSGASQLRISLMLFTTVEFSTQNFLIISM